MKTLLTAAAVVASVAATPSVALTGASLKANPAPTAIIDMLGEANGLALCGVYNDLFGNCSRVAGKLGLTSDQARALAGETGIPHQPNGQASSQTWACDACRNARAFGTPRKSADRSDEHDHNSLSLSARRPAFSTENTMTHAANTLDTPVRSHNATPSATWSSGGAAYDEISRGILDAIEHCTNRLAPPRGGRVLDVATGTGWAARRLAEAGVDVTGVDFAPDMLATAQELATARNLDIAFDLGDVEALPYPDASFDAVLSSFGVMFVQRPEDAAAELARICKPGARLALATWTPDDNVFEMFKIIKAYMPQPDGTPPPSPFEWGKQERVTALLGDYFDLAFERGTSFYREPDGQAAWRTFAEGYGPLRTLAGKLGADDLDALERDFTAFHDGFATDLGVCVPRDYLVTVATRR